MGRAMSKLTRPIRMINIDNRAEKVISKNKPTPAPHHEATKKLLEVANKSNPNFMEEHYKKDAQLDNHLKQIFVTSHEPEVKINREFAKDRPLPQARHASEEFEIGFWEPENVPPGKLTLRKIIELLAAHNIQPLLNNKKALAKKYDLDQETTGKLLTYYTIFTKFEEGGKPAEHPKSISDRVTELTTKLIGNQEHTDK